jgi:predicted esterase
VYVRIEGLQGDTAYSWDARVAFSSVPIAQIDKVLKTRLKMQLPDDHLKIVRLYLQAERYGEAETTLQAAIAAFPELKELEGQLVELRRLRARQQLDEIRLRREAGQHELAWQMLQGFPSDTAPVESLAALEELADDLKKRVADVEKAHTVIEERQKNLKPGIVQETFGPFLEEMLREINPVNISRMREALRLLDNPSLREEQRLALVVSAWLTGGSTNDGIEFAMSLTKVHGFVSSYLKSKGAERSGLRQQLTSEEAGTPESVARVIGAIKPPLADSLSRTRSDAVDKDDESQQPTADTKAAPREVQPHDQIPGFFQIETPGLKDDEPCRYLLQLPPEYQPTMRYPAVVTLPALDLTADAQVDWWAGRYNPELQMRLGQATRHGYVVIVPQWSRKGARDYQFSAAEHAAVLFALRDAMQRVSIDSDRVFLSGHAQGGDAAWDIGLAHPDLWAGVIPIVAAAHYDRKSDPRYITHYWPNARHVHFYFVAGERDARRLELNANEFNRYFRRQGFDTVVVEFQGRGPEHFSDEIQRIFRWMQLQRRDFFPKEIENVVTRRHWDNFFWYIELNGIPERSVIDPAAWPAKGAPRPLPVTGSVRERDAVHVSAKSQQVTVFLSPELVDFATEVSVTINGRKVTRSVAPDLDVLLEDARTRCDRQHPFWAKVVWRGRSR